MINPFDVVSSPGRRLEVFKSVYSACISDPSDDEKEEEIVEVAVQNEPDAMGPDEAQTQLAKMKEQFTNEMNMMNESLEQANETAKYERLKNNVLEEHVNKLTQDMEAKNKLVEELML